MKAGELEEEDNAYRLRASRYIDVTVVEEVRARAGKRGAEE